MERNSDSAIIGTVGLQDLSSTSFQSDDGGDGEEKKDNNANNNKCELRRMSIHSSERRKGRGRQLVDCNYPSTQKFDSVVLSTEGWMEPAISFYKSMGFKDMGRSQYNHE